MNINKTAIILILITLTLVFFVFQAQAEANQNIDKYCRTDRSCVPFTGDLTDEVCVISLEGIPILANVYEEQCPVACCCGLDPEGLYTKGYCAEQEGEYKEDINNNEYCIAICSGIDSYTITAQIKHVSGEVAIGTYHLSGDNTAVISGSITGGNLVITNVLPNNYTLTITSRKKVGEIYYNCEHVIDEIEITQNTQLDDIIIPHEDCQADSTTSPQPVECVSNWYYEFSHDGCGEVLSVTDRTGCNPPTSEPMYEEGDVIKCLDFDDSFLSCGNNKLDTGEQCDIVNGIHMFAGGRTCQSLGYIGGVLRCSNCFIDENSCTNCPQQGQECISSLQCNCPGCAEEIFCTNPLVCDETNVLTLQIKKLYAQEAGLRLEWNAITECLDNSKISIFKNKCAPRSNSCTVNTNDANFVNDVIPANIKSYNDYDFEEGITNYYCYKILLTTQDGKILPPAEYCERLPDPVCVGKPNGEYFCDQNDKVICNEGISSRNQCEEGERCLNPSNAEAKCVSEDICDSCSGPFGMFGFTIFKSQFIKNNMACSETENEKICFREDFSDALTAFGRLNHCADVNSCYNYKTKGSCERNVCLESTGECQWSSLNNNELGIGVCIPEDIEKQNCNLCDINSPFNYCTEEMCALYGDSCYYNAEPDKTSSNSFIINRYYCNNEHEVGCETYNNEIECLGGTSLSIDIIYQSREDRLIPTSGTHRKLRESNDILKRGICVWTGNACIRDADFTTVHIPGISDCDYRDKKCLTDFTPPITNVTINGNEIVEGATYSTWQLYNQPLSVSRSKPVEYTRYSIGRDYFYPNMTFNQFAQYARSLEEGGRYVIAYYSKDNAKNLEEIKRFNINLLTSLDIDVTHQITPKYYPNERIILSNLTLFIESEQNEYECEGKLYLFEGEEGKLMDREVIRKRTTTGDMNWTYGFLADGQYTFKIDCTDEFGQKHESEHEIEIDEDNTLSDPYPKGDTLKTQDVTISIISSSEATCTYRGEGPSHNMQGTFNRAPISEGRYNHTALIRNLEQGIYIFRPICIFTDSEIGEYEGNNGDLIYFGVDTTAPEIKIYDLDLGVSARVRYNESDLPTRTLTLEFECEDKPDLRYGQRQFNFGCEKEIQYRITHKNFTRGIQPGGQVFLQATQQEITKEQGIIKTGDTKTFTAPNEHVKITIYLTTKDKGGNSQTHNYNLRLRNATYEDPIIFICEPETEECT
jgi:hypothetical protein